MAVYDTTELARAMFVAQLAADEHDDDVMREQARAFAEEIVNACDPDAGVKAVTDLAGIGVSLAATFAQSAGIDLDEFVRRFCVRWSERNDENARGDR